MDGRSKRILLLFVFLQILLAFFDMLGVLLLGLVAAVSASAVTGQPVNYLDRAPDLVNLFEAEPVTTVLWLAVAAGVVLVTKSAVSFLIFRRSFRFLANRQAIISGRLASQLLKQPLIVVQQRTSQESSFALVQGVNALTMGVLGGAVVMVSEGAVLIVLLVVLILVDPFVALFALLFFGAVGMVLYLLLGGWVRRLGHSFATTEVTSIASVQQAVRTYRETAVAGRRALIIERFQGLRWQAASVQANLQIVNAIPKYIFEVALIVGAGLLAYFQILTKDVVAAAAIIAVFLAAASRIVPALLRLQGAVFGLRSSSGVAAATFELSSQVGQVHVDVISSQDVLNKMETGIQSGYSNFNPDVLVSGVTLTYPGADSAALSGVSLSVRSGESLAVVGPTGAGKSTLVDVLLGVVEPDVGIVRIGGLKPSEVAHRMPGSIGYVPQDVAVVDGSVRENVALGVPSELVDDEAVWQALARASIDDLLRMDRQGLETSVGENGIRLSGGQRQRLGLARALYTRPRLLVLDEATSALDVETEHAISSALSALEGEVTLVVIAHRLATIRHSDKVAYLDKGRLEAIGTFEEVRQMEPNFDKQAGLSGL